MTCEWTRPTLSSVLPEFESSGYRLAEMLDALMRGHPVRPRIQLYGVTGVVERFSTLDLTGSARIVSKAREYIRKNAATDLTLADIATAAGCSERVLQRRFREVSGKTPVAELRERRLEIVCDMLARTETPVDLVGGFCGFNSNSNLKAAFKTRYGLSMSEWRKRASGIDRGLSHRSAFD